MNSLTNLLVAVAVCVLAVVAIIWGIDWLGARL